jgi:transposase
VLLIPFKDFLSRKVTLAVCLNELARARASAVPELAGFATGIARDQAAVRAACTPVWSNGQLEGQVNRLKLLKRQMFGRANFDLLTLRVLHARQRKTKSEGWYALHQICV